MTDEFKLSEHQRRRLLEIARNTVAEKVKNGADFEPGQPDEGLDRAGGAFVTLNKRGRLRGCIGNFYSSRPLFLTIRDMAIAAATEDPRFPEVSPNELGELDIEISVLSPLSEISDLNEIEVGKHGIYITQGYNRGVLLPQVATEYGWDLDQFLDHTCMKAGLPANTWRSFGSDPSLKIEIFSAEVFGEHE